MQKKGVYFVGLGLSVQRGRKWDMSSLYIHVGGQTRVRCQVNSSRWKCSPSPDGPIGASFTAIGARLHGDVRAVKGRQGSVRGKSPAFCRRRGASRAVSVRKLWPSNRLGERRVLGLPSCAPERATGSMGERDGSVRKLTPFLKTFWRRAPLPLPLHIIIHLFFLKKRG